MVACVGKEHILHSGASVSLAYFANLTEKMCAYLFRGQRSGCREHGFRSFDFKNFLPESSYSLWVCFLGWWIVELSIFTSCAAPVLDSTLLISNQNSLPAWYSSDGALRPFFHPNSSMTRLLSCALPGVVIFHHWQSYSDQARDMCTR